MFYQYQKVKINKEDGSVKRVVDEKGKLSITKYKRIKVIDNNSLLKIETINRKNTPILFNIYTQNAENIQILKEKDNASKIIYNKESPDKIIEFIDEELNEEELCTYIITIKNGDNNIVTKQIKVKKL